MERFTMRPIAFVTTMQPYLLLWVLAISFFVTVAIVALLSREKTWRQILAYFAGGFVLVAIAVLFSTEMFLDIQVVDLEMIYVPPQSRA